MNICIVSTNNPLSSRADSRVKHVILVHEIKSRKRQVENVNDVFTY